MVWMRNGAEIEGLGTKDETGKGCTHPHTIARQDPYELYHDVAVVIRVPTRESPVLTRPRPLPPFMGLRETIESMVASILWTISAILGHLTLLALVDRATIRQQILSVVGVKSKEQNLSGQAILMARVKHKQIDLMIRARIATSRLSTETNL